MFKDKLIFLRFLISFIFATITLIACIIFFVTFLNNELGQGRALLLIFTFISTFACLGNCGTTLPTIIATRRIEKNTVSLVFLIVSIAYMVLSVVLFAIEMILY